MDTFIWSLSLAGVSGLTIVAYKHPIGFSRNIFPPLLVLTIVALVSLIVGFLGGMNSTTVALSKEVARMNVKSENLILSHLADSVAEQYMQLKYGIGISLVVALYLLILKYLPQILSTEHGSDGKANKNGDA